MPLHTAFFPGVVPFHLRARSNKELHFHLLKLACSENKLARYNLIAECFTYLCNSKRNLLTRSFLHAQEIHENSLCCFRTQINSGSFFSYGTNFGRKHQIELTNLGPVAR